MMTNLSTEEKRGLLAEMLQRKITAKHSSAPVVGMSPIRPVPRTGELPLSFPQLRQWFLDQLEPGVAAYNLFSLYRLAGALNTALLERSLNEVVQRHEILRTTFTSVDGRPRQIIAPSMRLPLPLISLMHLPVEEREAEVQRLARQEAATPFDLAIGPLIRAKLVRVDEKNHYILLTMHHIISDGWSGPIVVREVGMVYAAFLMGQPSPLPPLPVQYADYAYWQHTWLQGEVLERLLAYWRDQLADSPVLLSLPPDRPRPPVQTFRGAILPFTCSLDLSTALKQLSKAEGVTLFMTLLTGLNILLHRYTGSTDIPVGTYIANRSQQVLEPLLGFFVNDLVLRTSLANRPTVRELLHRVRDVTLGAYAHQDLPFEKLLEELKVERCLSHTPLFQVMMVLQNTPLPPVTQLPNLTLTRSTLDDNGRANYDLTVWVDDFRDTISGHLEYNVDLFDAATIERVWTHFETVLQEMVRSIDRPIDELPLMQPADMLHMQSLSQGEQVPFPQDACIHQLVEAQATRTPTAIALRYGDVEITYAELNARANYVAQRLRSRGAGADMLVGLCVERSPELIVGLLAILKAGATYVPLDSTYPSARLTFLIDNSRMQLILTQRSLAGRLPSAPGVAVMFIDDEETIALRPLAAPSPASCAYVIYTSGSTGRPKGVAISHRSLVHYTKIAGQAFGLSAEDRVLQFASISFDTAAEEIFPCLAHGATLVLRPDSQLETADVFLRMCRDWRVTVLDLPTAYWHELTTALAVDHIALPPELRLVVIGGEKARADVMEQWRASAEPHVQIINTYGPTESTIVATMQRLDVALPPGDIPIGRPLPNVAAYVLDSRYRLLPQGLPGELYIGGAGVARGYLHQPGLTAERFIPDPFSIEPGGRLYRTGDRARYRLDGTLEFLGRTDEQIKIRGFRVEIGEVETIAQQYPGVHEAVVAMREVPRGNQHLVAYIVPPPTSLSSSPTRDSSLASELRAFLRDRLPNYMVPAYVVVLDRLPLTPSGKIDRRGLPAPETLSPGTDQSFVAPATVVEDIIAGLFMQISDIKQIGVHDNFFEFGLHSLLATQFVSRIRTAFQIDLPVRAFFEAPTISELALVVEEALLEKVEAMADDEIEFAA